MAILSHNARAGRHHGLGLDVDGHVILAELSVEHSQVRPIRSALITPRGAFTEGAAEAMADPQEYLDGLRSVVNKWRLKGHSVALSIPSQLVVFRQLSVSTDASANVTRSLIERDVVPRLPFASRSVKWDYYPTKPSATSERQVVVVAAAEESIRGWVSMVTAVGLKPTEVEPSAMAALRWAVHTMNFSQEPTMLVVLMGSRVLMALVRDQMAVSLLQTERTWDGRTESYADEVAQDIIRSVMFFRSREASDLDHVVLVDLIGAGLAVQTGTALRLGQSVELCPEPLHGKLPLFEFPELREHGESAQGKPIVALGLALRRVEV